MVPTEVWVAREQAARDAMTKAFQDQAAEFIPDLMKGWTPAAGRRLALRLEIDADAYEAMMKQHLAPLKEV